MKTRDTSHQHLLPLNLDYYADLYRPVQTHHLNVLS